MIVAALWLLLPNVLTQRQIYETPKNLDNLASCDHFAPQIKHVAVVNSAVVSTGYV